MPAVQEQDQDLADPHTVRGQAAFPRASIDEHCGQNVYEALGDYSPVVRSSPYGGATIEHVVIRLDHYHCKLLFSFALGVLDDVGFGHLIPFDNSISAILPLERCLHWDGALEGLGPGENDAITHSGCMKQPGRESRETQ